MPKFISIDLYSRYKDEVWNLTNANQRLEPGKKNRGLTDKEIASKLGLTVEEVTEIRCIAEGEKIPLKAYLNADHTKEKRFKTLPGKK
jgi:DNA-directed RNA polymerase sigma subunit (sigma70/sigma32)